MRVNLNKNESVTVTLRSRGGGQIWIRARAAERSPYEVAWEARARFSGEHKEALMDHAIRSGVADISPRTYLEAISWPGDRRKAAKS